MAQISVSLPSDGETADAADVNTPITTIVNEINGNLDNSNIKADAAIAGSKLAAGSVDTTQLADESVTYAKTDGKIWWEEIGRSPALESPADTITVSDLPARKYLRVVIYILASTAIDPRLIFNGDTGSNYALRVSNNGAADTTSTSRSDWSFSVSALSTPILITIDLTNRSASEKLGIIHTSEQNTAGAGNAPSRTERIGKWANTSSAISSITVSNSGDGDFAAGSEVIVLGHD